MFKFRAGVEVALGVVTAAKAPYYCSINDAKGR